MPTPEKNSFAPQMIFLGLRPGGWANNVPMLPMIVKFVCVPVRISMTIPMLRTSVPCFLVCTTSRGSGSQQNPGRVSGSNPLGRWGAISHHLGYMCMYPYECLMHNSHSHCQSCVSWYSCAGAEFRQRPAELWQGFVPVFPLSRSGPRLS